MTARVRPRTILAWSAVFALAACNGIWGIDDGTLMPPDRSQAGRDGGEPGGAPPDGAGAAAAHGGEGGQHVAGAGGAVAGAGGEGAGGEVSSGGVSGGGSGATGGSSGSTSGTASGGTAGGGTSGGGTAGGAGGPSCSGCKLNEKKTESKACGRCGTGSQSHTATCDANCTWHWSDWNTCSQCDTKNYRCCAAGKWEWCYDSDCAWTNDCAACTASNCEC